MHNEQMHFLVFNSFYADIKNLGEEADDEDVLLIVLVEIAKLRRMVKVQWSEGTVDPTIVPPQQTNLFLPPPNR